MADDVDTVRRWLASLDHVSFDVISDDTGGLLACFVTPGEGARFLDGDAITDLLQHLRERRCQLSCLDMRLCVHLGFDVIRCEDVWDVSLLGARLGPSSREALAAAAAARAWTSQLKALRTASVDVGTRSVVRELVPLWVTRELVRTRATWAMASASAWSQTNPGGLGRAAETLRTASRLYHVERTGVAVDVSRARDALVRDSTPSARTSALRSIVSLSRDGFVTTRLDPLGGRTGRYRTVGGMNVMSLPHGEPRECVVSRHPGGEVVVVDFNAIDFRCIVASVPGLAGLYAGCDDFHARTTELLLGLGSVTPVRRHVVKQATYLSLYGGSEQTLSGATGLSVPKVRALLSRMATLFAPVSAFRDELHRTCVSEGRVVLPDGRDVPCSRDDHPGKVLGLYAQTYSSRVFDRAFVAAVDASVGHRTAVVFTVHDEVVIDAHPDEDDVIMTIVDEMRRAAGPSFAVKVKRGRNYGDASD